MTETAFARISRDVAVLREVIARALQPVIPNGSSFKLTQLVVHNGVVDQDSIVFEIRAVTEKKVPAPNPGRFVAAGVR